MNSRDADMVVILIMLGSVLALSIIIGFFSICRNVYQIRKNQELINKNKK